MKNLIGKNWVDASDDKKIRVINPATGTLIDTVPSATKEDVATAVNEALLAQKKWAEMPLYERGEILLNFATLVKLQEEDLAQVLCAETGKPIKEARAEIRNLQIAVPAFVEKAKHEYGINIPRGNEAGQQNTIQFTVQEPLGVIAAIIPFNFPVDLFNQKVPPALIMGNAVIVKPSSANPLTLHKLVSILIEAGVPYGVVQIISGNGAVTGHALASNPGVHLISLTGSTKAGIETMATASTHLAHVTLELGGNDAFILCEDGDIELAVKETIWGRFYNTGQVCCASKRFLIHKSVKDKYISKLIKTLKTLKVGDPALDTTDIGCLISEEAAKTVEKQVNDTVKAGAKIVYGGVRSGAFYEPTILDNVTENMEVAKDMEIFGPVVSIIEFKDLDDAIRIANQSSYGLCGNVFSKDMKTCFKVSNALECGGVVINGASFYRSFEMPFGGWKNSGIGNEGVSSTLKEMSRTKTVVLKNIME